MRKLIAVAAMICGLALVGCQTALPSLNISNAVAMNTVYGIENAYGTAVNAANAYKALPLCATGTKPSATNICAKRSVIVNLRSAMARARTAVNNLVAFQRRIQPSTSPRTLSARPKPLCTTFSPSSHQERSNMVTLAEVQAGIAIGEAIVAAIVKVAPAIQKGVVSSMPYAQAIAGLIQGNNATRSRSTRP